MTVKTAIKILLPLAKGLGTNFERTIVKDGTHNAESNRSTIEQIYRNAGSKVPKIESINEAIEVYKTASDVKNNPELKEYTSGKVLSEAQLLNAQALLNEGRNQTYEATINRLKKTPGQYWRNVGGTALKNIGDAVGSVVPSSGKLVGNALQAVLSMPSSNKVREQYGSNVFDIIGALNNAAIQVKTGATGAGVKAITDTASQAIKEADNEENLIRLLAEQSATGHPGTYWQGIASLQKASNEVNK